MGMIWEGRSRLGDFGLVEGCIAIRGAVTSGDWLGGDGNQSP